MLDPGRGRRHGEARYFTRFGLEKGPPAGGRTGPLAAPGEVILGLVDRLTEAATKTAERLIDEGNTMEDAGRHRDALQRYDAALALAPALARAHLNRGNVLLAMDDVKGAVASYKRVVTVDPKSASGHYSLGNALARDGQLEAALVEYRAAIALRPGFADVIAAAGAVMHDLARFAGRRRSVRACTGLAARSARDSIQARACTAGHGSATRRPGNLSSGIRVRSQECRGSEQCGEHPAPAGPLERRHRLSTESGRPEARLRRGALQPRERAARWRPAGGIVRRVINARSN